MAALRDIVSRVFHGAIKRILHHIRLRNNACSDLRRHSLYHFVLYRLSDFLLGRMIEHNPFRRNQISIAGFHAFQPDFTEGICQTIIMGRRIISLLLNLRLHFFPVGQRQIIEITLVDIHQRNPQIPDQHHRKTHRQNNHRQYHGSYYFCPHRMHDITLFVPFCNPFFFLHYTPLFPSFAYTVLLFILPPNGNDVQ